MAALRRGCHLIACHIARPFCLVRDFVCREQCHLRGRQVPPHGGASRRTFQCVERTHRPGHSGWCNSLGGVVLVTSRQGRLGRIKRPTRIGCGSDHWFGLSLESLAGFQHRVHDDCQLARHGNDDTLEADPLP